METEQQAVVDVRREENGRWSWVYREGNTRLSSNSTYASGEAAAETARRAYPGVRLQIQDEDAEPPPRGLEDLPMLARVLVVVAALIVGRGRRRRRKGSRASEPEKAP